MGKRRGPDRALAERWRDLLAAQADSGLSVPAFCERRGLAVSTFYYWKRAASERAPCGSAASGRAGRNSGGNGRDAHLSGGLDAFIPLRVAPWGAAEIEIELADARIRVPTGCDEEMLARVVRVLRGADGDGDGGRPC